MATKTLKDAMNDGGHDLRQALGRLNFGDMLAAMVNPTVDAEARAVADHVHNFADSDEAPQYGRVLAVQATVGGTTGPCSIVLAGTPATTQVKVEYTGGRPKLTFAAGDAVTACLCYWIETPLTRDGTSPAALLASEAG